MSGLVIFGWWTNCSRCPVLPAAANELQESARFFCSETKIHVKGNSLRSTLDFVTNIRKSCQLLGWPSNNMVLVIITWCHWQMMAVMDNRIMALNYTRIILLTFYRHKNNVTFTPNILLLSAKFCLGANFNVVIFRMNWSHLHGQVKCCHALFGQPLVERVQWTSR